jgi:hypothetical protein
MDAYMSVSLKIQDRPHCLGWFALIDFEENRKSVAEDVSLEDFFHRFFSPTGPYRQ